LTSIYNDYFGLKESPFSIAPNPQYLYMSDRHREALAHLMYGIQGDGAFILLSGEVGTGKTTICRCLLEQIPAQVDTAFILNPKLTAAELLAAACDDLKIKYPKAATIKTLTDSINAYLLDAHAKDRRTVLIIDEAQNLSIEVLEQLRLLTNLETNQRKLLQIILLGQPELLTLLAQAELRQLSQRITARFHLDALNRDEISAYIKHRLVVAGAKGTFFTKQAIDRIYKISGGIPRVINLVCDRALLGTYSEGELQVTPKIVTKAATEVLGSVPRRQVDWQLATMAATGGFLLVSVLLIYALFWVNNAPIEPQPSPLASVQAESESTENMSLIGNANKPLSNLALRIDPPQKTSITLSETKETAQEIMPLVEPSTDESKESNLDQQPSLDEIKGHNRQNLALADLLGLWGVDLTDLTLASCNLAETVGLICLSSIAGLNEMNDLNRPAIINLKGQWFTLERLTNNQALLRVDTQQYAIPSSEVLRAWNGNFTLFWRAPPGFRGSLSRGDRGAAVDYLVNRLAVINGMAPPLSPGYIFDTELESKVKQFQRTTGLTPDGIAGVKTWIKINDLDDIQTPALKEGIR